MASDENDALSTRVQAILNASGHPFQLYIQDLFTRSASAPTSLEEELQQRYRLVPLASELGWQEGDGLGFIDDVVGGPLGRDHRLRLVVETKRQENGVGWIFLQDAKQSNRHHSASLLCAWRNPPKPNYRQWSRFIFDPATQVAPFCIISKLDDASRQGERAEDIAGKLLRGVEALALLEPMPAAVIGQTRPDTVYLPLLVTNCPLYLATLDPARVDPTKGKLLERFPVSEVQYLRFQKSFPTSVQAQGSDLVQVAASQERTVLVVTARHLAGFLDQLGSLLPA